MGHKCQYLAKKANFGPNLAVYVRPKSVCMAQKVFFIPKKHQKFLTTLIFILEKGTFFFAQLFPVVARTWFALRSELFFGPKISVFGPKIQFLPYDPNFGQWPILALGVTIYFPPWDRFFWIKHKYGGIRTKDAEITQHWIGKYIFLISLHLKI